MSMAYLTPLDIVRTQQQPGQGVSQSIQAKYSFSEVRNALQHTASVQKQLAQAREDVLLQREKLRTTAKRVRSKRIEAGDAEAALMSLLRQHMSENHNHNGPPVSLWEAYNSVETLRNELGELEEGYLDLERNLTGSEWRFMDKENDFYQFDLLEALEDELLSKASKDHHSNTQEVTPVTSAPLGLPAPPSLLMPLPPPPPGFMSPPQQNEWLHRDLSPPHPSLPPSFSVQILPTQPSTTSPPPRVIVQPPPLEPLPQQISEDDNYGVVMAELGTLRRSFDTLRQSRANLLTRLDDENHSIDEMSKIGSSNLMQEQEEPLGDLDEAYFGVLQQISKCEVEAQRLRSEAMFREMQCSAIPRRLSDPTHSVSAAPPPPVFQRKAHSETAIPILPGDSNVKDRLQAWLLTVLQENPLQQTIYRDILLRHGLKSPEDESWEDRASHYWNFDLASEYDTDSNNSYGLGEDDGDCKTITRATSHDREVEGSSVPFTLSPNKHQPHLWRPFRQENAKFLGRSNISHQRSTSLPPPARFPNALVSSLTIRHGRSVGSQDCGTKIACRGNDWIAETRYEENDKSGVNRAQRLEQGPNTTPTGHDGSDSEDEPQSKETLEYSTEKTYFPHKVINETDPQLDNILASKPSDSESPYKPDIPTIVTTHADETSGEPTWLESQDTGTLNRSSQLPEEATQNSGSLSCESMWSQVFVFSIKQSSSAKSDYGGEKGRRERFNDLFSNLRYHKRSRSASYHLGNRDVNYDMGKKRKD